MASFIGWTNEQIEDLINDVYNGIVTTDNLPENLYAATINKLTDAVVEGFGGGLGDFNDLSADADLLRFYEHNIAVFSSAKTYQQVRDMSTAIFDKDGFKRPFSDFKKDAKEIFDLYNETWLRTEFDTSVNMAFSGRNWNDAIRDRDITPFLQYQTVGDQRVRPDHVELDNIVKHIDDPFWSTNYPPNGWNCRCIVLQLFPGQKPETSDKDLPPLDDIPPLFQMNPGKDKFIFNPKRHPYFNVAQGDKNLKANNFGLPVPPEPQSSTNDPT